MFTSFVDGTEEIVAGLAGRLGADLRSGTEVVGVRSGRRGEHLLEVREAGEEERGEEAVQADAVILAVPAYDAAGLLASVCAEASSILDSIRYVSTGTVSLAYKTHASFERLGGFGVLAPRSEKRPLNAVTWSSTKFDFRAPEGHSLLRVFFGGSRSPASMQLDDDELLEVVKEQLRNIMGIVEEPLFHRIYRWERANAQYDVEHLRRVEAVERALPPGIWVTGSAYRGVGLPDCVHQGQVTADRVVERLEDLRRQRSAS
jgi:oxygen-dependent protoporphyrinogen oxidase